MIQEVGHSHNTNMQAGKETGINVRLPEQRITHNGEVNETLQEIFQKVERAKQEWESAVDALPELICVTDYQGKIVRANQVVEEWNLWPLISIKGRSFHELLHPECEDQGCYLVSFLKKALQKELSDQPAELEAFDAVLGRYILIKIHAVTAKKEDANPTAAIVVQDISRRKQMEQALHSYTNRLEVMNEIGEAILEATSPKEIARAAVSRMRQLVPFQRAFLALSDPTSDKLLVIDVFAEGPEQTQPGRWLPKEAVTNKHTTGLDVILMIEDLSQYSDLTYLEQQLLKEGIHSYLSVPLIAQNTFAGAFMLGAAEPDTFHEEEIVIAHEVGDLLAIATHQAGLNQRLEDANTSLQQALQVKEEMIQNVSHELRTPLSIISGYANLMDEEAFGTLNGEQTQALEIILGRVNQLEFLLTRLLTLQTLDTNAIQGEQISMEPLLCKMVSSWQLRAETQDIELILDVAAGLPELTADPNLLNLAIGTLIDNAIKFSPGGGRITIQTWAENGELYTAVSDEGIGVPPNKLEQIFGRFVQADGSTTRSYGGMGIGLALCHDIVDAHGGRIWAESEGREKGSKFTIVLPAGDGAKE